MAPNNPIEASKPQTVDCAQAEKMSLPQLLYHVLTAEGSIFHGVRAAKAA